MKWDLPEKLRTVSCLSTKVSLQRKEHHGRFSVRPRARDYRNFYPGCCNDIFSGEIYRIKRTYHIIHMIWFIIKIDSCIIKCRYIALVETIYRHFYELKLNFYYACICIRCDNGVIAFDDNEAIYCFCSMHIYHADCVRLGAFCCYMDGMT